MIDQRPLVQARGLHKRIGQRVILDGVSLDVAAGETVALIGPSGGGKSTLLRALNALTPIDRGTIVVDGHELRATDAGGTPAEVARRVRCCLGMVFQDFQLFGHLSVLQNIVEAPLRVLGLGRGEAQARAMTLLERVGLADRCHAYPRELSGGQKQRVAIARALAMQPRGLLCDEITSALDPELKMDVLEILADLKAEGMTLVTVTHEIGFARRAADRVVVLEAGRILEQGAPAQVLDEPQTQRTRQFLQHVLA